MAALVVLLSFICLLPTSQSDQMYDVASVQVEGEDGTTQVFKVKRLEPVKGESCILCSQKPVNSEPRLTPLRSNVLLTVGEVATRCEDGQTDLPRGLCSSIRDQGHCSSEKLPCEHNPEELSQELVDSGLLPLQTGDEEIDRDLALGFVLLNMGGLDEAMESFNQVLRYNPNAIGAYYGRGIVYQRRGLQEVANAAKSVREFNEVILQSTEHHEPFERRAESYIALNHFDEALDDLNKAAKTSLSKRLYYVRGIVNLLLENFAEAESDFKKSLDSESPQYLASYFHLGLAQYYRGKVRNAIEVFKEVLKIKPDHIDASTCLGQAFRELGNKKPAEKRFNQSIHMNAGHSQTWQLWGSLYYNLGENKLAISHFDKCLEYSPRNVNCQYLKALSYIAMGKYYDGLKSATKVMIHNTPAIKASPEFLKSHYLREYARYLHSHLDTPLSQFTVDEDLQGEFKDRWAKHLPFEFKGNYKEQPGLQPDIRDVNYISIMDYPRNIQGLICKAHRVGLSMQVATDGYLPNRRFNFAMGLASLHIAQVLDKRWRELKTSKQMYKSSDWRDIFNIAVQYRRLVDPEQPVLWLDKMPDHATLDGYRTDITFTRGSVKNIQVMQYFDLVFKLAKTMLEHYSGEGVKFYPELHKEIDDATSCEDLLKIARKRNINQRGFMVSTQVPSSRKENERLDGSMVVLNEDIDNRILFSINIVNTKSRTKAYHAEIDTVFSQLQDEIRKTGVSKSMNIDSVLEKILTLVYYFYNLMPLTRGSSAVAYSVAVGLIMSVNRFVYGKIPSGKLLEMEAILSGAPDAFILVTRNWMNVKMADIPVTIHPKMWDVFPTVRSVLEVLNTNTDLCVMPAKP